MAVKPICFVHSGHHQFGFSSIHELWQHAGCFHFIDNPIPVTDCFHCHGGTLFMMLKEVL